MKDIQRREPYENNRVLNYNDLKEFFISQLELKYCKESKIPTVTEDYNNYRVWLLFAKLEVQGWICVQVAYSKNNIKEEIEFALDHLSKKWDRNDCKFNDSQFYKCVCPVPEKGEKYRDLLYRKIGNEGNEFKICVLDVDKYWGLKKVEKNNNNDAERIIEICKNQYAEAKIAYQTLAVYWRKAMSISGMCVALSSALIYDKKAVVLSVLGTYFNGIVLDHFIFGQNVKRRVCIITKYEEEVRQFILHELHSGATSMKRWVLIICRSTERLLRS